MRNIAGCAAVHHRLLRADVSMLDAMDSSQISGAVQAGRLSTGSALHVID